MWHGCMCEFAVHISLRSYLLDPELIRQPCSYLNLCAKLNVSPGNAQSDGQQDERTESHAAPWSQSYQLLRVKGGAGGMPRIQ